MKSQIFFLLQCDVSVPPPPAKDPSNYPVTAIISTRCAGRNSGQGGNWVPRFPLFIEVIGTSVLTSLIHFSKRQFTLDTTVMKD